MVNARTTQKAPENAVNHKPRRRTTPKGHGGQQIQHGMTNSERKMGDNISNKRDGGQELQQETATKASQKVHQNIKTRTHIAQNIGGEPRWASPKQTAADLTGPYHNIRGGDLCKDRAEQTREEHIHQHQRRNGRQHLHQQNRADNILNQTNTGAKRTARKTRRKQWRNRSRNCTENPPKQCRRAVVSIYYSQHQIQRRPRWARPNQNHGERTMRTEEQLQRELTTGRNISKTTTARNISETITTNSAAETNNGLWDHNPFSRKFFLVRGARRS